MTTEKKAAITVGIIIVLILSMGMLMAKNESNDKQAKLQSIMNDERAAAQYTISASRLYNIMTSNQLQAKDYVDKIAIVNGTVAYVGQFKKTPEWYYVDLSVGGDRVRCQFRDIYVSDLKKLSEETRVQIKGRVLGGIEGGILSLENCVIVK